MRTKQTRRRKRGGTKSYYSYNKHPILFTNVSNKRYGGDSRNSFMPLLSDAGYQVNALYNASMGKYPPINPSPLYQNLIHR